MLIRVVKMSSFHIASLLIRWNPSAGVNHQMRIVDIWSRSTWICSLEGSKLTLTVPRAKSKWLWNCWRSRKVVRFSCLHFFFFVMKEVCYHLKRNADKLDSETASVKELSWKVVMSSPSATPTTQPLSGSGGFCKRLYSHSSTSYLHTKNIQIKT